VTGPRWSNEGSERFHHHRRFLAGFSPAQRLQAQTNAGFPFAQMSLAQ
jgi:hypothetical protein